LYVSVGHVYRLLRTITLILQKKFQFLAPKLDGLSKRFDRILASRKIPLLPSAGKEMEFSEEGTKEKPKSH
ncbi:MAG: hypothetical protein LUQ65_11005, partial [Candidatus Helarchaeota archaeon]|nr:hypothetical protein [Candidatus Helarchaeota archaeon]